MRYAGLLAAMVMAASFVLCGISTVSADQTFLIQVAQDAWVNEANPSANYGSNTYMSVKDRSGSAEGYLRFDQAELDALLGKPVTSASLFLYQYQGTNSPGDAISLHSVTSDWNEATVSWDSKPGYAVTPLSSLAISGESDTTGWREWTGLESSFASWAGANQFGLALENNQDLQDEELYARFYTSEYSNAAFRPYLKVTAAPEPVSMLLFTLGGGVLGLKRWKECRR